MKIVVVADVKERFSSVSIFSEGWKAGNIKKTRIIRGNFLDKTSGVAEKIKNEIDSYPTEEMAVIMLIPRSLALVTSLELPAQKEDLLPKMMEFEITRHFPIPIENLSYDYFVADRTENGFQLNLAGLKQKDFERWHNASLAAGINPEVISISSGAWLMPETNGLPVEKRAYIEILPEGFEVSIVKGKRLMYSKFKRFKPEIDEEIFFGPIINSNSATTEITDQILEEIDRIKLVSGIEGLAAYMENLFIAGGGSMRQAIAAKLSSHTAFLSSVIKKLPENDSEESFGYVAQTAAIAESKSKPLHFNFIPEDLRKSSLQSKKRMLKVAALALAALFIVWGGAIIGVQWKKAESLKAELAELKSKAFETEKTLVKVEELKVYFESFNKFVNSPSFNLELLESLTSSLPQNTFLLEMDATGNGITISGISDKSEVLLNILESSPKFRNVRLIGPVKTVKGQERFKIGMELE